MFYFALKANYTTSPYGYKINMGHTAAVVRAKNMVSDWMIRTIGIKCFKRTYI